MDITDSLNSLSVSESLQSCCFQLKMGDKVEGARDWISYGVFTMALENDHIHCFKTAHRQGYEWNNFICSQAAFFGNLEMLRFAHTNGCEWDRLTTASAAYSGSLQCLVYAHVNNCPWNVETCNNAAVKGNINCLQYAILNGCPVSEYTLKLASTLDCFVCILKKLKPHLFKNPSFNPETLYRERLNR